MQRRSIFRRMFNSIHRAEASFEHHIWSNLSTSTTVLICSRYNNIYSEQYIVSVVFYRLRNIRVVYYIYSNSKQYFKNRSFLFLIVYILFTEKI